MEEPVNRQIAAIPSTAKRSARGNQKDRDSRTFVLWVRVLILAVPSLVMWGIMFPGFLQADHQNTISGIAMGNLSEWHSLLWGFLSYPLIYLSPSFGLYGLLQIGIFVAAAAYSITRLSTLELITRRTATVLTWVFALCPTFLLYNLLYSSDVVFAVLLLPLTVQLMEVAHSKGACLQRVSFLVGFGLLLYAEYELRKNAMLIVIVVLIVLFVVYKMARKRLIVLAAACLAAVMGTGFVFSNVLHAEPSPSQELLSVPVQQIARAYQDGGTIPEDANRYLTRIHSREYWTTQYLPYNADPVKFQFDETKEPVELTPEFVKAWVQIGLKNPGSYVRAYLDLMNPYWQLVANPSTEYIDTDFMDHDNYTRAACGNDGCRAGYVAQFQSNYSPARRIASTAFNTVNGLGVPLATDVTDLVLFNRALPLWMYAIGWIVAVHRRQVRAYAIFSLPMLCILASLLAFSPVASFRYSLQMYYVLPVLLAWMMNHKATEVKDDGAATLGEAGDTSA